MGMRPIIFNLRMFDIRGDEADYLYSQECLQWLLEALVNCNRAYLRRYPQCPSLYASGVRYARERGTEDWSGIRCMLKTMRGDCEDLASWRVAELRERTGEPARPYLKFRRVNGFWHYHIQVMRYEKVGGVWLPKREIEDPSRILGMNVNEAKPLAITQQIATTA